MSLPYWIEHDENGQPFNYVWIKVNEIPAQETKTFFVVKENGYFPDGDSVFDFFDDFDGDALDTTKWEIVSNTGATIEVTNGYLRLYRPSSKLVILQSLNMLNGSKIIEYRQKIIQSNYRYSSIYYGMDNLFSSIGYSLYSYYESALYTGTSSSPPRCSSSSSTYGDVITDPNYNEWFKEVFIVPTTYLKRILNGSIEEISTRYTGVSEGYIGIKAGASSSYSMESHTEFIFVRKHSDIEPTVEVVEKEGYCKVAISNPSSQSLVDYQIPIPITALDIQSKDDSLHITEAISPLHTAYLVCKDECMLT